MLLNFKIYLLHLQELEHLPNIKIPSEEHNIEHEIINGDYHVIDITDYTEKSTSNSIKKVIYFKIVFLNTVFKL